MCAFEGLLQCVCDLTKHLFLCVFLQDKILCLLLGELCLGYSGYPPVQPPFLRSRQPVSRLPWALDQALPFWYVEVWNDLKLPKSETNAPHHHHRHYQVSFTWGILLFQEPVSSKWLAFFAVSLMVLGISGMSYYLSPQAAKKFRRKPANEHTHLLPHNDATFKGQASKHRSSPETVASGDVEGKVKDVHDEEEEEDASACNVLGRKISKRTLGICAAIFRGCWGGSMIVPMHWAPYVPQDCHNVNPIVVCSLGGLSIALCVALQPKVLRTSLALQSVHPPCSSWLGVYFTFSY